MKEAIVYFAIMLLTMLAYFTSGFEIALLNLLSLAIAIFYFRNE
jgi:uncharacterized membrane protein YGL010W